MAVSEATQDRALLSGLVVGVGVLSLFLSVGFLFADWNLPEALSHITPRIVGSLLFAGALVIAVFGVPVAAYVGWRLLTPAVVFVFVVAFWSALALSGPVITASTATGLVYYGLVFSPVYLILYALCGGFEYYVRSRVLRR